MTLGDVANKARALTNTDINSYPDAQLLIDVNIWYQKVVTMIYESMDESDFDDARYSNYPIQTTPIIAGQRDYALPVSEKILKMKRVDISYDGTNFYRATPFDDGEATFGMGNDALTDQNYIQQAPRYDLKYNSLWIYPMGQTADAVAGVIRMVWDRNVIPFTTADYGSGSVMSTSTIVLGFDDPFHPIVAQGAAYEYAVSKQLPQMQGLAQQLTDWEIRLRQAYGKKDLDRQLAFSAAINSYTYH